MDKATLAAGGQKLASAGALLYSWAAQGSGEQEPG